MNSIIMALLEDEILYFPLEMFSAALLFRWPLKRRGGFGPGSWFAYLYL